MLDAPARVGGSIGARAVRGAMILWAIRGRGSLRAAVGQAVDAVLAAYLR